MSRIVFPRASRWSPVFIAVSGILSASAAAQEASSPATGSADDLQEVVITAIIDAAKRASDEQKNSRGVTNVVASDSIGRFPDPNIAEALQRVVG